MKTAIPIQSISRTLPEITPWLLLTRRFQVPFLVLLPYIGVLEEEIRYELLVVEFISTQVAFSET